MSVEDWIPGSRERVALWGVVLGIGAIVAFVFYSFVGTFVLGLFIYYGVRPVYTRLERVMPDGAAAVVTLSLTALPFFAVAGYLALMGYYELVPRLQAYQALLEPYINVEALLNQPFDQLGTYLRNPDQNRIGDLLSTLGAYLTVLASVLMNLLLAALFAFYLLKDGDRLGAWFEDFAGANSAAYAYAGAVDRSLETMYFSTVLLVFLVSVGAVAVYHGYNFLAPAAVHIPLPTVLAIATGLAVLIPIIVGKVVYVPLVGYLLYSAVASPADLLVYPVALLVVCFVFLDFVPMTFVLPEIAGRNTHVGLVMFGFVVGSMVFGWYGLFLGPLVVVAGLQAVRVLLKPLVYGNTVTGEVDTAEDMGADPP